MIINEARDVWGASQAALTECYGLHPESFEASCKFTSSIGGRNVKNLGRISNGALGALQKDPDDTVEAGTSSRRIACHPGNNKRSGSSMHGTRVGTGIPVLKGNVESGIYWS